MANASATSFLTEEIVCVCVYCSSGGRFLYLQPEMFTARSSCSLHAKRFWTRPLSRAWPSHSGEAARRVQWRRWVEISADIKKLHTRRVKCSKCLESDSSVWHLHAGQSFFPPENLYLFIFFTAYLCTDRSFFHNNYHF